MFEFLSPADKPVIAGLEKHETVWAKDQPQYKPLRALVSRDPERRAMSRWTFTPEQRQAIAEGADLFLTMSTFGSPLQPVTLAVAGDADCYDWRGDFHFPADVVPPAEGSKA